MYRNVFLVDMTEHRGLEQSALRSVQAYASECNPELIDWFKLPRQAQPELTKAGKVFSVLETGLQLWPQIRQRLLELSSNGYAGCLFHMISYDPYVLTEARNLSRPEMVVRSTPLAVLLTKYRTSFGSARYGDAGRPRPSFNQAVGLTPQEGLELTKRVLKQYGHTSPQKALLVVQLRPLLVRHDQRARKNPMDRSSSRLISSIIAAGTQADSIRRYDVNGIPGTERIWLVDGEGCGPSIAEPAAVVGGNGSNGAISFDNVLTPSIEGSRSGSITRQTPSVPTPPAPIDGLPDRLQPIPADGKHELGTDKGRQRTRAIEKALTAAGVYSKKPQRDRLFKALRSCLSSDGPRKTLLQLTREIRREASAAAGGDFPFWHPATRGYVGMLLGAGALLDESGKCVRGGLFVGSSQIASFVESLEDTCEAFLLETAITRMADITDSDKVPLAHALFWDKDSSDRDQIEDRLEQVLRLLEGRLNVTAGGVWYVEGPGKGDKERTPGAA